MIINLSRASQFQECRTKAYNWHEKRLMALREADALIQGGAIHTGFAKLFATGDVNAGIAVAEEEHRKRSVGLLAEEQVLLEQQIELSRRAVAMMADQYKAANFQVLWPEVEFTIPLPNTEHHCFFFHRIAYPNIPYESCGYSDVHHDQRQCWQPIYFRGKTDAVVLADNMIWLLETKTTSITGNIFYDRFYLDFQPTGYIYGIAKSTGTRPHGFFLNVVKKPNKRSSNPLDLGFEREPFLRSDADLERFERELIVLAEDYEHAWVNKRIYMNTKSCTNYNRRCYYWELCKRGGEPYEGEFRVRDKDYVDLAYYQLLGIEVPNESTIPD